MQNGKGDKPRPIKNRKQFLSNWDEIDWEKNCSSSQKQLQSLNNQDSKYDKDNYDNRRSSNIDTAVYTHKK